MEIEKKFLLKEKNVTYANSKFFPNLNFLKLKIILKGKRITQSYLPMSSIKKLNIKLDFSPDEIRLRKIGKKHFLTIKSKGNISRHEFEKQISKEAYKKLIKLRQRSLIKIRLIKIINNHKVEIDYCKKYSLLTCEIEVKSKNDLDKIPNLGKDISSNKKYKNKNLAK
jgi:CYTH domain-containing protein